MSDFKIVHSAVKALIQGHRLAETHNLYTKCSSVTVNNAQTFFLLLDHFRSKVYVLLLKIHSECELYNYDQPDATLFYDLFLKRSTCFDQCLRPSSRAHNCTSSFRYCQPILLTRCQPAAVLFDNT